MGFRADTPFKTRASTTTSKLRSLDASLPESRGARIKRLLLEDHVLGDVEAHEKAFSLSAMEWSDANAEATMNLASVDELEIQIANEYGPVDEHPRNLYGYDHVIEP